MDTECINTLHEAPKRGGWIGIIKEMGGLEVEWKRIRAEVECVLCVGGLVEL